MMSSRWPRPIGIMASMALMPVWSGSLTAWRSTTPGALNSTGRNSVGLDGALVVERAAERVDDAADHGLAHRHLQHAAGALDEVALLDERVLAEEHGADVVFFEVEGQPDDVVRQLEHLHGHAVAQAVDAGDAVADLEDGADLFDLDLRLVALDLGLQDGGDLFGSQLHWTSPLTSAVASRRRSWRIRAWTLPSTMTSPMRRTRPPRMEGSMRRAISTRRPVASLIRAAIFFSVSGQAQRPRSTSTSTTPSSTMARAS